MPNTCVNMVTIIGHKEDLDELEASKFNFENIVPVPEPQGDIYSWRNIPYSAEDVNKLYEFRCEKWGTKWNRYDESYQMRMRRPNYMHVVFHTAWCPPMPIFEAILRKYPRSWLKLEYSTEDYECGVWTGNMNNGELVSKSLEWDEPRAELTTAGEIYLPNILKVADASYEDSVVECVINPSE